MTEPSAPCDVLIVDDDAGIRDMLTMMLDEEGYRVSTAVHGGDALTQLESGLRPHLILLDWRMPIMSGAQFRAVQRADPELAMIPVVVISANTAIQLEREVDANALLFKPLRFDRLLDVVEQYCAA